MRFHPIVLALTSLFFIHSAQAQCVGENLIAKLPDADRTALYTAAHAAPFASGNLWRATKGDQIIHLTGTYHLDDPRHVALMTTLTPLLAQSKTLLVEAGPKEEAALENLMNTDPSAMMDMAGSGLSQTLPPEDWEALSAAMSRRGIPPFLAEKMLPWFVSMMLSIPPCALQLVAEGGGLDKRLINAANDAGIPVEALEPFDTALGLFDGLTQDEQTLMIRNALQMEPQSEDLLTTTADAFFDGEGRLIWELSRHAALTMPGADPEQTEIDIIKAEKIFMSDRNQAWIPRITAAAEQGPVLVAFGALHLSGDEGVLNLLQAEGYTLTALP